MLSSLGIVFKLLRSGPTVRSLSNFALMHLLDRRSPQTRLTPRLQGRKSVTRSSSARNGPMPIAAKASLKTSRVLATSARAASARATERSEGCISANSSARPRVSRAVPQATVATMARPTSSSVADNTLRYLRGNHQIRTRKNLPPFPHRRSQGLKREHPGHPEPIPFGPRSTSREMMICSKTRSTTAAAEGAGPPSPRYRAS
jgi:hypothetical protein